MMFYFLFYILSYLVKRAGFKTVWNKRLKIQYAINLSFILSKDAINLSFIFYDDLMICDTDLLAEWLMCCVQWTV